MIEFIHLYKTYTGPVHALKDITFQIDKGEFVFLTGASGAGKSTLFRMILAQEKPSSGQLIVRGQKVETLDHGQRQLYRRRLGVVFQDFKLLPHLSVFTNVALPLRIRGDLETVIRKRVHHVLDQVGLFGKQDCFPPTLSGGEQQRVAIARALIAKPDLLIADEPTGNLDPQLAQEIMDIFEGACAQGTTVFLATHDLETVKRRGKRTIEIEQGRIKNNEFKLPQTKILNEINWQDKKLNLDGSASC